MMYSMPARDTVAGDALSMLLISNTMRMGLERGMRSLDTRVSTCRGRGGVRVCGRCVCVCVCVCV